MSHEGYGIINHRIIGNKPNTDSDIELEIVGEDGRPIIRRPIDVGELLAHRDKPMDLGNGIHVQLEEYGGDSSTDEEETEEDEEETDNDSTSHSGEEDEHVPAGYRKLTDWYDALQAACSNPSGRLRSVELRPPLGRAQSRREVWAAFAPPADSARDYRRLQSVSLIPSALSRRFWLPPLSYHAAAAYLAPTDQCQRILILGGTTNMGRTAESELYEFNLLSGNWRRMEGRQFTPPGGYAHAMIVVPSQQRVVVIGGVGRGGKPIQESDLSDSLCRRRFRYLFPRKESAATTRQPKETGVEALTLCSLSQQAEGSNLMGFIPLLFDMSLKTQRWRAVQTAQELPVALHTAVVSGETIYVFGGITNRLLVSAQLIRIHAESYGISLVRLSGSTPKARFLHTATMYGNWMIIYGGFDVQNEPLNDVWAFDTVNERWEQLDCVDAPPRGGHAACVVGSRLVVLGGFETAFGGEQPPSQSVFELQLVPTGEEKYHWRPLTIRPAIPPLAFSTVSPCGDEASFILYGGCTVAPRKRIGHPKPLHSATNTTGSIRANRAVGETHRSPTHLGNYTTKNIGDEEQEEDEDRDIWHRLVTYGDGLICTFAMKRQKTSDEDTTPHVNALGVEIDPDEIPAEFQAFVRRQQDFLLKKEVTVRQTMRKTTLDEKENMEPQLYLTLEEIESLITKSEELCGCFVEYRMDSLPPNTPDRETRLHLNEECVSLSRQVRDVLKSMKGSEPGITAVKSKTHRKRTGEKFQDHSAAKPFRRVVVMTLMRDIQRHLRQVHALNKALRTVEWPEKGEYIEAVHKMREQAREFIGTIKSILDKYIEHRVESLMSAVEKRRQKLRLLKEVVEKNRHDKIFPRDGPDPQRERVKREWGKSETKLDKQKSQQESHFTRRARSKSAKAVQRIVDGPKTTIPLLPKELEELLRRAEAVQRAAVSLESHCRSSITTSALDEPLQMQELQKPQATDSQQTNHGLAVPTMYASLPVPPQVQHPTSSLSLPLPPSSFMSVPSPNAVAPRTEESGTASPKMLVIRKSDSLRRSFMEISEMVRQGVSGFAKSLTTSPTESAAETMPVELHLVSLQPLMDCKTRLDVLETKISGIRMNEWAADNLEGAPQDMEAARHCERLTKSLTALVQRVTMGFLSRAGAKPPRQKPVPRAELKPQSKPQVKSRGGRGRQFSVIPNTVGTITVAPLDNSWEEKATGIVLAPPMDDNTTAPPPSVIFTELSTPLPFVDPSLPKTSETPPRGISITSGEAAVAHVSPLSVPTVTSLPITADTTISALTTTATSVTPTSIYTPVVATAATVSGAMIVPSLKDTQVIPNTQPAVFDAPPQTPAPPVQVILTQSPFVDTERSPSLFQEMPIPPITSLPFREEAREVAPHPQMVSFAPGRFHMNAVVPPAVTPSMPREAEMEEDYFFFGRRQVAAMMPASQTMMEAQIAPVTRCGAPFLMQSTREVPTSPPVGSGAIPTDTAARFARPQTTRRPNTAGVREVTVPCASPLELRREIGRGEMFRGRLTPGEALILRGREKLRGPSSSRR